MQPLLDFLNGKKTYLIAAVMAIKGIFEFEYSVEGAEGFLDALITMLDSMNSMLTGGALASIRAAISKMG